MILLEILTQEQYATISAIPRIVGIEENKLKEKTWNNLVELEHKALTNQLFSGDKPANVWWKAQPQWCGEVQGSSAGNLPLMKLIIFLLLMSIAR